MPHKTINVMIVDDSAVVRGMVKKAFETVDEISLVASVHDGQQAVDDIGKYDVDVIILDIEMPRMDGITALPLLLKASPKTKVIMASTLTMKGAGVSMKCLTLGASDYIEKPVSGASAAYYRDLILKVKALGGASQAAPKLKRDVAPAVSKGRIKYPMIPPRALAIASSTGGPQVLMQVMRQLEGKLKRVPIFITQHMPANFTTILAQNLSRELGRDVYEASDGQVVVAGGVYLAPGDYHMRLVKKDKDIVVKLDQGEQVNFCRPAADPMIESLVEIYKSNLMLAVFTGMGSDGMHGAEALKAAGGMVLAQDEPTSTVWGMPKAIVDNNLQDAELPLDRLAPYIAKSFGEAQ